MTEHGVSRDAAWVNREYGSEKWPAILNRIEEELAAGETDLARIVNKVKDWELSRGGRADKRVVVMGRPYDLPHALGYRAGANLIFEKLASLLEGAEAIIELGSGWGYNLFHLWLTGAPRTRHWARSHHPSLRLLSCRPFRTGPFCRSGGRVLAVQHRSDPDPAARHFPGPHSACAPGRLPSLRTDRMADDGRPVCRILSGLCRTA